MLDLREITEFLKDASKYIITALVVVLVILYVVTIQQVVGPSMSPTLKDQDIVLLNKFRYYFFDIERLDVVALKYDGTKYLIKRVIGLPGETIEYKDNVLYINNAAYKEIFLNDNIITEDFSITELGVSKIPDDMYLVLGDNRGDSLDSRKIGFIKKDDILGKVSIKIWPINEMKFVK